MSLKYQAINTSLCIRDISRLGAKRRRRHSKTCVAVFETSEWSPVAKTRPRGLSYNYYEIKACFAKLRGSACGFLRGTLVLLVLYLSKN
jgi:hypothetical protein